MCKCRLGAGIRQLASRACAEATAGPARHGVERRAVAQLLMCMRGWQCGCSLLTVTILGCALFESVLRCCSSFGAARWHVGREIRSKRPAMALVADRSDAEAEMHGTCRRCSKYETGVFAYAQALRVCGSSVSEAAPMSAQAVQGGHSVGTGTAGVASLQKHSTCPTHGVARASNDCIMRAVRDFFLFDWVDIGTKHVVRCSVSGWHNTVSR